MLIFNPTSVRFGELDLPGVTLLSVDRRATAGGTAIVHAQTGPWPVWADVKVATTTIKLVMPLTDPAGSRAGTGPAAELTGLLPGQFEALTFSASDQPAGRAVKFAASCMVLSVQHDLPAKGTPIRTITLLALADDPAVDPIAAAG